MRERKTLRLKLTRALSWTYGNYVFLRSDPPLEIEDEYLYYTMIRLGFVSDPDQQFQFINPRALEKAPVDSDVLILRDMGMGDVLMASLAIRALAEKYPRLRITYGVDSRYVDLFRDCWFIERTMPICDIVGQKQRVIDLRGYTERHAARLVKDRIEIMGDGLGVAVGDFRYAYAVSSEERAGVQAFLGNSGRARVGIAVRGSSGIRSWPLHHVIEFCRIAVERGWTPVVFDHQAMTAFDVPDVVNLTGRLGMRDLAAVISECDVVVSPDTGITHLAEAVETPCIAIFSTIDPAVRISHYRFVEAIWRGSPALDAGCGTIECAPCWEKGCAAIPCVEGVPPMVVIERAREVMMRGKLTNDFSSARLAGAEA